MSVETQVIAILAEQAVLDPAMVTADMTLAELGLDSLALVEYNFVEGDLICLAHRVPNSLTRMKFVSFI